ncbi:MAG TPA: hypothetical protein VIB00_13745 [Pyrinomonadaceae bacterium]|jgi:hypothetical protein
MKSLAAMSLVLLCFAIAAAQSGGKIMGPPATAKPYTPERGSAERKAIIDALRVPVEKQLKQSVIFKVDQLRVQKGWAFFGGMPQTPDGREIDYTGTVYQEAIDEGAFDGGVFALLRNVKGKWKVVQYVIGATDVPYVDWDKEYGAPRAIFNMP